MLNGLIRLALQQRLITIALALVALGYGGYVLSRLPIDVFPDLNRPRVTVLTEAPGLAPEEVETLVTFPLESVLNGATGVQAVRSSSGVGLSVVQVEFAWGTDLLVDRQIVNEKLALAAERLPAGVRPQLAPVSSIMGQIQQIGLWSETGETDPIAIRTLADWVVRQRLLTIPGVAQVVVMGGGRRQFQVRVHPEQLLQFDLTLADVEQALLRSNAHGTGGYLELDAREYLVRTLGRVNSADELGAIVVKPAPDRPVLLRQVARVVEAPQTPRGDAAVNGVPAVMLTVSKQPGADTRRLTDEIHRALAEIQPGLPRDVRINPAVFQQRTFIDLSIQNVLEALRDGGVLVLVVLFVFLLNFRTTFITLTAIPLSVVMTGLVFHWFGLSINTMTLGGLAVALGELVDDAIVDVENIYRRLRENRQLAQPRPPLRVVYDASLEVRGSIVFSTILVVLVFVPLFALEGMEGRLFTPLGVAYVVSILASLLVSLTVTPVLSYWLLPTARFLDHGTDGWLLRQLKRLAGVCIRFSLRHPAPILATVLAAVLLAGGVALGLGRDFLPPFNEGSVQVNLLLPPGSSLAMSNQVAQMVERQLRTVEGVLGFGRRTGRAELDEHAEGVNVSELIVSLDPQSRRGRDEVLAEIREKVAQIPGVVMSAEQPLQHLISHMLSGVKAQVGIKLFGDDLAVLRQTAEQIKNEIGDVPGVTDLLVEQQTEIPQLQVRLDPQRLASHGLTSGEVTGLVETALYGRVVSEVLEGERRFDLVVRLDEPYRSDPAFLPRMPIPTPGGGRVPLSALAEIREASGPSTIQRENVRRRIVVQCNTAGRDLVGVVADIRQRLAPLEASLPAGYHVEYGGQFESQQQATRRIGWLSLVSLAGMFLALYTLFRSVNLALQVLAALPMAAIGAVAALVLSRQSLTVASLVGFISLAGIASRNGILLIAHYLHLVRHEGEAFTPAMIERAGKERLAPMLMTALTAGIGLVPLVLAAGEPGKEILHPVATVILGGLISSTLLDFFVHPALFWLFGRRAAEMPPEEAAADRLLSDPETAPSGVLAAVPTPLSGN
ncbi:MAG: efflux RND transporter permease subunit [Planctomycetaceae bacterium]